MRLWVGFINSVRSGSRGENGNTGSNFPMNPAKTSCPGSLQVRRFHQPDGRFIADAIYEIDHAIRALQIVEPWNGRKTEIPAATDYLDLLVPIFRHGDLVYRTPTIEASRQRTRDQLSCAPPEILRLNDPPHTRSGSNDHCMSYDRRLIARAKEQLK